MHVRRAAAFLAWLLLLIALHTAAQPPPPARLISSADNAALYSLRASLALRARDWPRRADPCANWTGVGCSPAGRVVTLNLTGLRRTRLGRLSPRFAVDGLRNLTELRVFNSTGFALPGQIPEWFGEVNGLPATLQNLDLSSGGVNGSIPANIAGASGLTVLKLAGNFIAGEIPAELGRLANLTVLDLSNNNISGSIPAEIGNLSSLSELDLSFNSLSGSLPDELGTLTGLRELNLENNSISGTVSDGLFKAIIGLRSVRFGRNKFTGSIPDSVWGLSELQVVDFSDNGFTGVLPDVADSSVNVTGIGGGVDISNNLYYGIINSSFSRVVFGRFNSVDISENYFEGFVPFDGNSISGKNVSFQLNCFNNATNQRNITDCEKFYVDRGLVYDRTITLSNSGGEKHNRRLLYILVGVLGGVLLIGILVLSLACCIVRRRRAGSHQQRGINVTASTNVVTPRVTIGGSARASSVAANVSTAGQAYSYGQLACATSDFSDGNLIKNGHSGDLYRGKLEDGAVVVVKRIDMSKVAREGCVAELELFARGLNPRLVPFLGHCLENENEKFLVYKYVSGGDLYEALQRRPGPDESLQPLDWLKRLKIANGIAEALYYLHNECTPPLVHRDIQATSIFLDDKFEVRLGSLSEVSPQEEESQQNVITKLLRRSQTSDQGSSGPPGTSAYDVYCFGKVLLELVTGRIDISSSNNAASNEWLDQTLSCITIYDKELVTKIVDPFLVVHEDHLEEVWAISIVARSCLNPRQSRRPPVKYILKALENPLKVVREESYSGSGRLRTTSSRGSWNGALFGSWRQSSSDVVSLAGQQREDQTLRRSGTLRSQDSEHSFSQRKPSREIFPEPSTMTEIENS